jgi:hypothetical protein
VPDVYYDNFDTLEGGGIKCEGITSVEKQRAVINSMATELISSTSSAGGETEQILTDTDWGEVEQLLSASSSEGTTESFPSGYSARGKLQQTQSAYISEGKVEQTLSASIAGGKVGLIPSALETEEVEANLDNINSAGLQTLEKTMSTGCSELSGIDDTKLSIMEDNLRFNEYEYYEKYEILFSQEALNSGKNFEDHINNEKDIDEDLDEFNDVSLIKYD